MTGFKLFYVRLIFYTKPNLTYVRVLITLYGYEDTLSVNTNVIQREFFRISISR